jgi:hypothetical protein
VLAYTKHSSPARRPLGGPGFGIYARVSPSRLGGEASQLCGTSSARGAQLLPLHSLGVLDRPGHTFDELQRGVLILQGDGIDPLVQEDLPAELPSKCSVFGNTITRATRTTSFESELESRSTLATLLATKHTRERGANLAPGATPNTSSRLGTSAQIPRNRPLSAGIR